ncbi:hypothetical protein ACH4Q6_35525 [Streptomyces lydicus]|uniref:Ricin B lectin domain-containing protein n=1 Tax=Streptomyces lydicus TaxID=47763 RepID=A0A1D7VMK7_9ACTN|nr:hypothetical protein [Streptomyces lydicus]AOP47995.1 hypothetical protein SL103_18740 [Streptomyces lydicus]
MANELKYGDKLALQNGYNNWAGGYLDTNSTSSAAGALYKVSTAPTPTRGPGTGTWQILSTAGKATGQLVQSGDVVYLRNLYGNGSYLDTNGGAATAQQAAGGLYAVTTSPNQDRAPGTGRWQIFAQTSTPTDKNVRAGDVLLLWNLYSANGGFLETNGLGTESGSAYSVCTNAYFNRAADVTLWKASLVP